MKNTTKAFMPRNHKRFQIIQGAYAVLRDKPIEIGTIINMSKDGLAVRYRTREARLSQNSEIDIYIIDCHFYIEKIKVRTIADFELPDEPLFDSKKVRQRCLQFEKMKSVQLFQRDYFLANYTTEKEPALYHA